MKDIKKKFIHAVVPVLFTTTFLISTSLGIAWLSSAIVIIWWLSILCSCLLMAKAGLQLRSLSGEYPLANTSMALKMRMGTELERQEAQQYYDSMNELPSGSKSVLESKLVTWGYVCLIFNAFIVANFGHLWLATALLINLGMCVYFTERTKVTFSQIKTDFENKIQKIESN